MANPLPATLTHQKAAAPGIAVNRRVADGPIDHEADIVSIYRPDGTLACLWVNFACHPVTIGPLNYKYSADFPGHARAALEQHFAVPVLYTTGCCGQINLGHPPSDSIRGLNQHRRTPEEAQRVGERLAQSIVAAYKATPPPPGQTDTLSYAVTDWPASFEVPDVASRARIKASAEAMLGNPEAYAGELATAKIDLGWLAQPHPGGFLTVGALAIGSLRCVFLPGEIFVETALDMPATMCVSYTYSNMGYVPYHDAERAGGYEVDDAWRLYGAPGPFAAGTSDAIEAAARRVLEAVK